mmetsp:Transcript_32061/g.88326  ORF Transcript_32061/g.88326 Transcript_32061/m.88326 type:complete len:377 (-) Transcript_32061:54-1184(-)
MMQGSSAAALPPAVVAGPNLPVAPVVQAAPAALSASGGARGRGSVGAKRSRTQACSRCYHCKGLCERQALELLQGQGPRATAVAEGGSPCGGGRLHVLCVGDSITSGVGASGVGMSYPAQLQRLLGDRYLVTNLGACGATMHPDGDSPYQQRVQWRAALRSRADAVVVMLGTNDARPTNWGRDTGSGAAEFETACLSMIRTLQQLPSKPLIYLVTPPPFYNLYPSSREIDQALVMHVQAVVNEVLPVLVPKLGRAAGLAHHAGLVDVFMALGGAALSRPEWSADGCHPNDEGYFRLAAAVQAGLQADARLARRLARAEEAEAARAREAQAVLWPPCWPQALPLQGAAWAQVPQIGQAWPSPAWPHLLQAASARAIC